MSYDDEEEIKIPDSLDEEVDEIDELNDPLIDDADFLDDEDEDAEELDDEFIADIDGSKYY